MLPKELRAAINNLPLESRLVLEVAIVFYEHHFKCLEARITELEDQLAKDSCNSNKSLSSDTFTKPSPKGLSKKTGRKLGDPKGHDGTMLKMVDCPDGQVTHRVEECEVCKIHLIRTFETFTGARYFARTRNFVSTAQKQHISILDALKDLFGDNQIQLQLVRAAE